ncbi:MAG: Transcriptional regulator, LysR family, partial [uncultured Rubrobacteraceae bacterium]
GIEAFAVLRGRCRAVALPRGCRAVAHRPAGTEPSDTRSGGRLGREAVRPVRTPGPADHGGVCVSGRGALDARAGREGEARRGEGPSRGGRAALLRVRGLGGPRGAAPPGQGIPGRSSGRGAGVAGALYPRAGAGARRGAHRRGPAQEPADVRFPGGVAGGPRVAARRFARRSPPGLGGAHPAGGPGRRGFRVSAPPAVAGHTRSGDRPLPASGLQPTGGSGICGGGGRLGDGAVPRGHGGRRPRRLADRQYPGEPEQSRGGLPPGVRAGSELGSGGGVEAKRKLTRGTGVRRGNQTYRRLVGI